MEEEVAEGSDSSGFTAGAGGLEEALATGIERA